MTQTRALILLIMIAGIFKLFSCNVKSKKEDLDNKITQSIDDFNNRPIHKKLTVEIIDSTADNNLLQVVFDNLSEKIPSNYELEFETVLSWNKSRQAIYMIWLLEGEVNNGGFNQFYFNSSGQFYKYLPSCLKLIGAIQFADLTERANKTFEQENDKIKEDQDGTIEGFSESYEDNPLNDFDDEFYSLYDVEILEEIHIKYIREHKLDFVDQ